MVAAVPLDCMATLDPRNGTLRMWRPERHMLPPYEASPEAFALVGGVLASGT